MTGHTGGVWAVCALPGWDAAGNPDGRTLLATTGEDGSVRIWDPSTGHQHGNSMTGHTGAILGVCTLPGSEAAGYRDGHTLLVTAGEDGSARIWDPTTGRVVSDPLSGSSSTVNALAPRLTAVADCIVVTSDGVIRAWNSTTSTLDSVSAAPRASTALTIAGPNDELLVIGDTEGMLHTTDVTGHRILRPSVQIDDGAVLALCRLPGRRLRIAGAGRAGTITVLDLTSGEEVGTAFQAHPTPIRDICFIERPGDSQLLAAGGNDGTIRIWDLATSQPHGDPLTGHDGWIWSLTVLPPTAASPPRLASGGADQTIRFWDPYTSRQIGESLVGHTDQVRAVICPTSGDGRTLLVSGSHDGTVRLWHPNTGAPIRTIPLGSPIHSLCQENSPQRARERTFERATLIVGLRTGILALDLHSSLFPTW
jgi:WD40 repeat protein